MSLATWEWTLAGVGGVAVVYAVFVGGLVLAGRRAEAGALARFVPDCLVLFRRLLADPRVSRRRKVLVVVLLAYLAMPFDLVPDFIPVAGQLDDAIAVVLAVRVLLRGGGETLLREHWPGPAASLDVVLRVAGGD